MWRDAERESVAGIQGYLGARNLRGGKQLLHHIRKSIYLFHPPLGALSFSFFFFFHLLPTSWSSVRPSVRLCQFHCRPFLFPPPLHIFFFELCVTSTPLTCTKHMHEPNASERRLPRCTHTRTDGPETFFFFLWGNDDDVEAKNLWPFWCSALKTSSPVT
jgi:hypothetical protein